MKTFQVTTCDRRLAAIKTFPILEASSLILPFPKNFDEGFKILRTLCKNYFYSGYFAGDCGFCSKWSNMQSSHHCKLVYIFMNFWPNFRSHEFCRICKETLCMFNCTIKQQVQEKKTDIKFHRKSYAKDFQETSISMPWCL